MDTDHASVASDEPPVRVMALHALAYCERLFYLEEVEEIRVANARVFAGRELHAGLEEIEEEAERQCFELASKTWGLIGKVDCLRRRDGTVIPYEHKRGRPRPREGGGFEAWPSDRLQVAAYTVLLEEALERPIAEARVRYHAKNVTVRVPIDQAARDELRGAIERARTLRESVERPPVTQNERLCTHCSLAPVCLPEEVRLVQRDERDPKRLFPPDRDGASLHVVSQGARVGRKGDQLCVSPRDGPETKHAVREIDTVVLHGYSQISTQAIRHCCDHNIGVHWLTTTGRHVSSTVSNAGQVQRRLRQYEALANEETRLRLAKTLVSARVSGQHGYLLRASRGNDEARRTLSPDLSALRWALREVARSKRVDELRGKEGAAAVRYHSGLRSLLSESVGESLRTSTRNRRPPRDRFNALLSYGYGLLHVAVTRAVLASGLEPALGFYHTPRSAAYPLVLDLMELFRVTLWDLVVVGSLNRGQWDPEFDFSVTPGKVWLSESGRKKAIGLFEARLQERWKHPVLKYSLSYARTIELEARLLEKEWTGEPGLFARSRLR